MSDLKLFSLKENRVEELKGHAATFEKDLQNLIEANMEAFLGVRFLAREYTTVKTHKGRIDSLGLDENNAPVIIEYKRHQNENVINQGLFYLDWLMDHQAELQCKELEDGSAKELVTKIMACRDAVLGDALTDSLAT